jgi:hypothetical protein
LKKRALTTIDEIAKLQRVAAVAKKRVEKENDKISKTSSRNIVREVQEENWEHFGF